MIQTSIDLLRAIIAHDALSGKMWWKPRGPDMFVAKGQLGRESLSKSFNSRIAGTPALDCLDKATGYLCGNIYGRRHQAHRVLWAIEHGEWPSGDIDHINGVRSDNRIENLRAVDRTENLRNKRVLDSNKSGFNGVYWGADRKKWRAEIGHNGKAIKLGSFDTLEEAISARQKANIEFGYHPNHGMR